MRLATYEGDDERSHVGLVADGKIIDLTAVLGVLGHPDDVGALLRADTDLRTTRQVVGRIIDSASPIAPVGEVTLLPPVVWPRKILCIAANYREHIEESKVTDYLPRHEASPWFFEKPASSLNGHRAPVVLPALSDKVDWEVELGVIIGRGGRAIPEAEAGDHIAGYTVVNDVSAREVTIAHRTKIRDRDRFHDWLHGKWFDTFCCVGPWMVTADEVADAGRLPLGCDISGQRYQDSDTAHMIFSIAEQIAFISQFVTLEPGDLIATGTPSGVGKASGRYLRPGDTVTSWVGGVGTLHNPVVDGG